MGKLVRTRCLTEDAPSGVSEEIMVNLADNDGVIWLDGELIPWRDAKVHVLTHTLHYGAGVFEGVRAYETPRGPAVFRLDEHLERFYNSAKIIKMTLAYDKDELVNAVKRILVENKLKSAYIRPMSFFGSESMGIHAVKLRVHTMVAAWEWGALMGESGLTNGIRVKTSSFRRSDINSAMLKAKINGHYVNSLLAAREAVECGYEEALLLDHQGFVAEGSGENFFMVKSGTVYTPPPATILEGITRASVLQFCKDLEIPFVETNIARDQVYLADEAFFTGTAAEITPIRELDAHAIGNGGRGPITEQLQNLFFEVVHGKRGEYENWLTYLE